MFDTYLILYSVNSSYVEDVKIYKAHKDAREQAITGLQDGYRVALLTKYGTSEQDITMSERNFYEYHEPIREYLHRVLIISTGFSAIIFYVWSIIENSNLTWIVFPIKSIYTNLGILLEIPTLLQ